MNKRSEAKIENIEKKAVIYISLLSLFFTMILFKLLLSFDFIRVFGTKMESIPDLLYYWFFVIVFLFTSAFGLILCGITFKLDRFRDNGYKKYKKIFFPSACGSSDEKTEFKEEMEVINKLKLAEEALSDAAESFNVIFEYAPDGYYISDLKGNFINGNRAAEIITGYARGELIGKNYLETGILSKEYLSKALWLLAKNAIGLPTGPDEFNLIKKDGSIVTVEIMTYPVKISDQIMFLE